MFQLAVVSSVSFKLLVPVVPSIKSSGSVIYNHYPVVKKEITSDDYSIWHAGAHGHGHPREIERNWPESLK